MAFRRSLLVVGLFDWKLKLASELGATHTINSQEIKDVKKEIKSLYQEGVMLALLPL